MNRRGPDALIGCIPGEIRHSGKLLELCIRCHDSNQVLVCSNPAADLVLVPRDPEIASRDQLYFVVYATNVRAVQHCECLRLNNQVAVILDIDQTLVDATHVDLNESDMKTLEWVDVELRDFSGNKLVGRVAHAPGSDAGAPTQDRAFFITWRKRMHTYSFYVRVRRGWNEFRQFLIDNSSRFAPFVCSKGKLEYVQLIWTGLDPAGRVLSRDMWSDRIFSTFPDHLPNALDKTILSALGCATVTQNRYCSTHSQIAAPVLAVDDSPDAYETCFSDSILFVEEFRPSEAVHADRGSVLRQVRWNKNFYLNKYLAKLFYTYWNNPADFYWYLPDRSHNVWSAIGEQLRVWKEVLLGMLHNHLQLQFWELCDEHLSNLLLHWHICRFVVKNRYDYVFEKYLFVPIFRHDAHLIAWLIYFSHL